MSDNESLRKGSNSVTGMAGQAPGTVNIGLDIVVGRKIFTACNFGATAGWYRNHKVQLTVR